MMAAFRITLTEAILVKPITPVFSPYVVLAGPPKNADTAVAIPSPDNVRDKPGSFKKFLFVILLNTVWSPICSATVTNTSGKNAHDSAPKWIE